MTQTESPKGQEERLRKAREAFYGAVCVEGTGTVSNLDEGVRAYAACLAEGRAELLAKLADPDFRNEFQHLRAWSDLDTIHDEAAEALLAAEAEKAVLAARVEELQQETERLSAIAEGRMGEARLLKAGSDGRGGFSFDLTGGPIQYIAEYLAQLLGKNEEDGPHNYAEIEVQNHEFGLMTLTLQRKAGKTPHQLRQEAESRAKNLQGRLDELGRMMDTARFMSKASSETMDGIVEVACKGYWPVHWPKHFDPKDAESIREHMRSAITAALERLFADWNSLIAGMSDGTSDVRP